MKKLYCSIIMIIALQAAFAEEKTKDFSITPVLGYDYWRFEDQQIHSPSGGVIFTKGDLFPPMPEEQNGLMIMGMYKQSWLMEDRKEYPDLYHDIQLLGIKAMKRHLFIGVLSSQAAEPFYGGLNTFTAGAGYAYEFIRKENISFYLGAAIAVSDFGIEFPNGTSLPVLPIPIARFNAKTSWADFSIEFLSNLTVAFTLFPESKIRLTGNIMIDPFGINDVRDLYFDTTLWYRFFSKESKMGDFMGLGLGVKNAGIFYNLSEKEKSYGVNSYSAYGVLDMSFLRLSCGYSFSGREIFGSDKTDKLGSGFFISAMLGWQF